MPLIALYCSSVPSPLLRFHHMALDAKPTAMVDLLVSSVNRDIHGRKAPTSAVDCLRKIVCSDDTLGLQLKIVALEFIARSEVV